MTAEWVVRGLEERDLEAFLDHCALCFKDKGTPREYFARHWENDPWASAPGIRAAVADGEVVGTVRIFDRRIWTGGGISAAFGGIGEVATHPRWRGRGIAQALLQDAAAHFAAARGREEHGKGGLLGLHAAEVHMPLYQRAGFAEIPLQRSRLQLADLGGTPEDDERRWPPGDVRPASPAEMPEGLLGAVMGTHARWSGRFFGPLVRDDARYWRRWVAAECGSAALEIVGGEGCEAPRGYLSLKPFRTATGGEGAAGAAATALVTDCAFPPEGEPAELRACLRRLATRCLADAGLPAEAQLLLPAAVGDALGIARGAGDVRRGHMYCGVGALPAGAAPAQADDGTLVPPAPHVFWPADGF